jgi:transcriptional regulator with XRE-family HTH domain
MYERILAEMKKKGIRFVAELERTAGLSQGSIKNIRYGHIPTPDRLVKIADALDVSVQYLLTGDTDVDPFDETVDEVNKRKQIYSILEGLSPENFQAAIDYLTFLKNKEGNK